MSYRTTLLVLGALAVFAMPGRAETYGNFETMGVVAGCPAGYEPRQIGPSNRQIGQIKAFLVDNGKRRRVHDFVEVASAVMPRGYYATSLFDLKPNTEYTIAIEYYDGDGKLFKSLIEKGRTRPEPVTPPTARSLYVSPTGDDRCPGTKARPFRTLAVAVAAMKPGTTLWLRGGVHYAVHVVVPTTATRAAPLVIRNYPGETAVVDGSIQALTDAGWRDDGDGIYSAPGSGMTWNVTVEERSTGKHFRCYPLRTLDELRQQKSGGKTFEELGFTGAYHWDGKRLHLRLPKGRIDDYQVHVALLPKVADNWASGLLLHGGSHLYIDGLTFRYVSGDAILLTDASECLVSNCRVEYCNAGVWVKGNSSNNTVQDSTFIDNTHHWSFEYTKTERGWEYNGQVETGAVCVDGRYSGRGLVVRRNLVQHMFDGSHLCPWIEIHSRTSETDFYRNRIEGLADDFLETDGFSRNVRIFDNYSDGSLSGLSLAEALDGPTWVVRNIFTNWGVCTATQMGEQWGYPIKTNGGDGMSDLGSGQILLYHNTSWTKDPDSRAFLVKHAMWRGMRFRNNIWCGKGMGIRASEAMLWPVDWDYDDVYHDAGPFALMGGQLYQTLDEFRRGRVICLVPQFGPTGIGQHLLCAEPGFRDAAGGDYRLRENSPCLGAGEVIPGINDLRFTGKAPDLGAIQSGYRQFSPDFYGPLKRAVRVPTGQ